jgi:hypothetical protein
MIIFEILQWFLILFMGLILYQCYKTLKAILNVQKISRKQFEVEIRKIYDILNGLEEE